MKSCGRLFSRVATGTTVCGKTARFTNHSSLSSWAIDPPQHFTGIEPTTLARDNRCGNQRIIALQDRQQAMAKSKQKPKQSKKTMAEMADKFACYQKSVQTPDHEVEFFEQAYRDAFKKKPYVLREDFCGTFAVCCEWVASHPKRTAIGVDFCGETLQWGRDHNLAKLSEHAAEARAIIGTRCPQTQSAAC